MCVNVYVQHIPSIEREHYISHVYICVCVCVCVCVCKMNGCIHIYHGTDLYVVCVYILERGSCCVIY